MSENLKQIDFFPSLRIRLEEENQRKKLHVNFDKFIIFIIQTCILWSLFYYFF